MCSLCKRIFPKVCCRLCRYSRSANGDRTNIFLGIIYTYQDGHSWIIDGYKTVTASTERIYEWVSEDSYDRDENGNIVGGSGIFRTDILKSTDDYFRMNWGWGNSNYSNQYYTLGGDWIIKDDDSKDLNFKYKRSMIHNFAIK